MDFTEAYDDTSTTVSITARLGDVNTLKDLLLHNKPTNSCDNRGWRALHEASSQGHHECVRLLVMSEDAEVDAITYNGLTALYLAVAGHQKEGESETVQVLLQAGADPDMDTGDSWSLPLPRAVGNVGLMKQLLDAGANPNKEEYESGTALHAAVERVRWGTTSCLSGVLEVVTLLLDHGADVNKKSDIGHTPFHALMLQHLSEGDCILDLFLDRGINVNVSDDAGTTPLMLAVQSDWKYGVWRLLECGADVNLTNLHSALALHYAIEFPKHYNRRQRKRKRSNEEEEDRDDKEGSGEVLGDTGENEEDTEVFEKLLSLTSREKYIPGVEDPQDKHTYSLYHLGLQWERFKSLKVLLDAGIPADCFLQETSSQIADFTQGSMLNRVPLMVEIGINRDTPLGFLLTLPLSTKMVDLAKYMIDKGSSVNAISRNCLPPLVALVRNQRATYKEGSLSLDLLLYLIDHGADITYKIRKSDPLPVALHVSCLFNSVAFFRLLQSGVPAHQLYTHHSLTLLKESYIHTWPRPYNVYDLFPWLVISWLHTVNLFVPQLPLDTRLLFDKDGCVDDPNLSAAWLDLDVQIGSPKSLQQLCILSVRCAVGEARGWKQLPATLNQLSAQSHLPQPIMDQLQFRQVCLQSLIRTPPDFKHPKYDQGIFSSSDSSDESSLLDSSIDSEVGVEEMEEEDEEDMSGEEEDEEDMSGEEEDEDEDEEDVGLEDGNEEEEDKDQEQEQEDGEEEEEEQDNEEEKEEEEQEDEEEKEEEQENEEEEEEEQENEEEKEEEQENEEEKEGEQENEEEQEEGKR